MTLRDKQCWRCTDFPLISYYLRKKFRDVYKFSSYLEAVLLVLLFYQTLVLLVHLGLRDHLVLPVLQDRRGLLVHQDLLVRLGLQDLQGIRVLLEFLVSSLVSLLKNRIIETFQSFFQRPDLICYLFFLLKLTLSFQRKGQLKVNMLNRWQVRPLGKCI